MSSSTPSSSPPLAAPVATPGAPLVLQPVSPSDVTPGGTPFSPSLFTQLQAAQASSGASAVGAILMARSKELMGFTNSISEANPDSPLIDEETKARFLRESNELQGFAELLQTSPEGMAVSEMWSTLAQKYNDEGSGLQNEALNLWTQLNSSSEAQEITETSADILRQWKEFAMSSEGAKLIKDSQNMLKDQSSVLGGMLQSIGTYFASTTPAPSPAPSGSSSTAAVADSASPSPAASSISVPSTSASPAVGALADAGLTLHKEKLMKTTHKVSTALAGDEDVKLLLAKSSNLIKSYSASPAIDSTKSSTPGISSSPAIESDKKEDSRTSAASPLSAVAAVTDPNAVADATGVALKAGENYLKSLRESEVGNVLLAKGLVLLQQNKDMLKPENFTSMSSTLASDAEARQQFLTKMKDVALDFLLSYLPTIVVPPVTGEKDRVAYEISNIDLGGFHVDSNNVVVTIDDNNSIEVRATKISCEMKNLIWNYKKLTFPKLSGKGTADANAKNVEFVLKLKLQYPKPDGEQKKENETDENVEDVDEATDSDSEAPDMVRVKSKSKSEQESKSKSPSMSPEPAKRPKSASIAHLAKRAKEKAIAAVVPSATAASSSSPPVASSASPEVAEVTPAAVPAAADVPTPVGAPVAAPPAGPVPSFGEKLLETVKIDLGRPKLVMDSCFMKLHDFDIRIHTGYFKTVYNFLLGLFKDSVKLYLENTLNNAIVVRSVYLLDTINVLAVDYLPLLQRIMIKATTAAIAEDTPIDETIANAAQGLTSAVVAATNPSTSSAATSSAAPEPVAEPVAKPVAVAAAATKSDSAPAAATPSNQLSSQSLADFYKI